LFLRFAFHNLKSFITSPILNEQPEADEGHPQRQPEPGIVSIIIIERPGASRSVAEIKEIIGGKKRSSREADNVYHTSYKSLHHSFSLYKTPFSPLRTGPED
jgi:hypothetical protein